jgi:hypothetical protein
MAAADGITGHEGDDDLGHGADEFLEVEDVEAGDAIAADVAGMTAHALVAAGAEGVFAVGVRAGTGEQHDADGRVFARIDERLIHLHDRLGAKRVALLRPVDRDLGDAIGLLVADIGECFDLLPNKTHARNLAADGRLSRSRPPGNAKASNIRVGS